MTAPLSQDLRARIVRAVEGGSSARAAAERFEVSPSAAIKLMQRVRQTGSTAPAQIGGHRRPVLEPHAETVRALATSKASITLKRSGPPLLSEASRSRHSRRLQTCSIDSGCRIKKQPEGSGAGPARRGAPPRVLARLAALHGWRAFRVPG